MSQPNIMHQPKNFPADGKTEAKKRKQNVVDYKNQKKPIFANTFELFREYGLEDDHFKKDCSKGKRSAVRVGLTHRRILNDRSEPLRHQSCAAFTPLFKGAELGNEETTNLLL